MVDEYVLNIYVSASEDTPKRLYFFDITNYFTNNYYITNYFSILP